MKSRDETIGQCLLGFGVIGGLLGLAVGSIAPPTRLIGPTLITVGSIGAAIALLGACFLSRGKNHSFWFPFTPWRWELPPRVQVRELPIDDRVAPLPATVARAQQQLTPVLAPLQYNRVPRLPTTPNRGVPVRVFAMLFHDRIALGGIVITFVSVGVLSGMMAKPGGPSAGETLFIVGMFATSLAMLGFGISRVVRWYRYAVAVTGTILRIEAHTQFGIVVVEYALDEMTYHGALRVPLPEAQRMMPGDKLDVMVNPVDPHQPLYDLVLAGQVQRYDAPADSINQKLALDPTLAAARARLATVAGVVVLIVGIWQSVPLFDLEKNGGSISVWGPVAMLYNLFGAAGTLGVFIAGGLALLIYAAVVSPKGP